MNWYNHKKIAQETQIQDDNSESYPDIGYFTITNDFKVNLFDLNNWQSVNFDKVIAKGLYNIMNNGVYEKTHVYLASLLPQMNLSNEEIRNANQKINQSLSNSFSNLEVQHVKSNSLASSFKSIKEARQSWPIMNAPSYDPYKKNGPGDQNGGTGVSYRSRPGSTGLGTDDTYTKGPKGVDIGRFPDSERSEMLDLMHGTDGVDPTKTNEGRTPGDTEYGLGFGEKGWEPWYDDNFPENSDKYDEHPAMLSRMPSKLHRSVFDELASKRKK